MNPQCVKAIMKKDTIAAIRNSLVLMGLISGIMFAAVYYVLPASVEETFDLAVYGESQVFSQLGGEEGIAFHFFESSEDVEKAVEEGDYVAGLVLPKDFDTLLATGEKPEVVLYFDSEQPENVRTSIAYFIELAVEYAALQKPLPQMEGEILGEDMAGKQIPLREQSIPLYLVMALVMEMWTISTLIVEESAAGTLRAVLVTPASPSDVILSKGVVGIGYSLLVAVAILVLTKTFRGDIPVLFLGVLLGALLSVTLGLFLGSLTNDITGSYIYVGVPLLILILPGLVILLPGASLSVIKAIPTYYLVDAVNQILNHGAGLSDVWRDFAIVGMCDIGLFFLGVISLRRRYS
ncbi:MAG: ABC transporter permease [Theionarchaea archaeon]|nr:ABC transporter permease [Theionarchaea archaeon]MBU7001695.1 ABC transporter permease [Theionarchaea archaeon]MBU7021721.1 ABC transporter permease [Theionarchaea archaeon]MBU7041468.1 ABC transporter permease [Theionarchaea archaeon]